MYSRMVIGNKYRIITINDDEFVGIIKRIEPRSNGIGFIDIETTFYDGKIYTTINLNHIVSFYELIEKERQQEIEPSLNLFNQKLDPTGD